MGDLQFIFYGIEIIPVSSEIVTKAMSLKHRKNMILGDALNAATTITCSAHLITTNIKDFD
ncbi:MAG: hypothetical protein ACXIUQ_07605 [Cecembia sp.]